MKGKVSPRRLSIHERGSLGDLLATVMTEYARKGKLRDFVEDFFTESEHVMHGRRLLIAKDLLAGQSYESVRQRRKVGLATIASVDEWLESALPEYRNVLQEFFTQREKASGKDKKYFQPYSFAWFRRKYPLHCLLINFLLDAPERTQKE